MLKRTVSVMLLITFMFSFLSFFGTDQVSANSWVKEAEHQTSYPGTGCSVKSGKNGSSISTQLSCDGYTLSVPFDSNKTYKVNFTGRGALSYGLIEEADFASDNWKYMDTFDANYYFKIEIYSTLKQLDDPIVNEVNVFGRMVYLNGKYYALGSNDGSGNISYAIYDNNLNAVYGIMQGNWGIDPNFITNITGKVTWSGTNSFGVDWGRYGLLGETSQNIQVSPNDTLEAAIPFTGNNGYTSILHFIADYEQSGSEWYNPWYYIHRMYGVNTSTNQFCTQYGAPRIGTGGRLIKEGNNIYFVSPDSQIILGSSYDSNTSQFTGCLGKPAWMPSDWPQMTGGRLAYPYFYRFQHDGDVISRVTLEGSSSFDSSMYYEEFDSYGNRVTRLKLFEDPGLGYSTSSVTPPSGVTLNIHNKYAVVFCVLYPRDENNKPIAKPTYFVIDRYTERIVKQGEVNLPNLVGGALPVEGLGNDSESVFLVQTMDQNYANLKKYAVKIPLSAPPKQEVVSPAADQMLSDLNTAFVPTVKVSDANNDTLTLKYFIDSESSPRDSKSISNTATEQTVSFNAFNAGALAEGPHTMNFTAYNGTDTVQSTVNFTVDKAAPAIGTVNLTSSDTSIGISGTASDSVSGLSSTPYRYTVGSDVSSWTASPSYSKAGLTPNTNYNVKFEAMDKAGHTSSQTLSIRTKAQVPSLSLSQATETSLELSFTDSNPSGTPYQIKAGTQYVSGSGTLTSTPDWFVPAGKKIKVTGLTPNKNYSFQAKAKNNNGEETAYSSVMSGVSLASPPGTISSEPSQRWIRINWPETTGVANYDVEADGTIVNNGASASYLHSSLTPNTKHTYRVRVNNASGKGSWSQPFSVFTLPDPPAIPINVQAMPQQTEMTVSWDVVARAETYDIEIDGVVIDNGNKTSYMHQGLQPLTDHSYRIRAKNAGGIGDWSQPLVQKTLPYPPSTPANATADPSIHHVSFQWDSAEGATSYEIEVDGLILDNKASTSYVHEELDELSGHTYRVRAVNIGGKSPWSEPLNITTHPEKPVTPANLMATAEEQSTSITWYQVPHAASYEVEVDGGNIETMTSNQFEHNGILPDSSHTYRVRAVNISGYSEWSNTITISTLPNDTNSNMALTNMAAVVTNRTITLSWDTVAPDAQYEVEVDGKITDIGADTIYHHGGLQVKEFHTYKIRWKNTDGPGQWVAVLSLSTLPDPLDAIIKVEAFATNNSIELRWDKVNGAMGYDIEIDGETVVEGMSSTYIQTELSSGTSHTYRVRAKNETGVTAWSDAIIKSTTSPFYMVQAAKGKTFDLSLLASNVQDFSELTYVVTYDANRLEVADLYDFTPEADLITAGAIPGSNIEVTYVPGKITFKKKQNIVPGTSWSGEIATIVFKSKVTGQSTIDVKVE